MDKRSFKFNNIYNIIENLIIRYLRRIRETIHNKDGSYYLMLQTLNK